MLTLAFYEQLQSHKQYCFWHFLKGLCWFQRVLSDPVQCHIYESKATKIYILLEKRCNLHELHLLDLKNKNSNPYWHDLCLIWVKGNELLIALFSRAQNSLGKRKKATQHDCVGCWFGAVSWDLGLPCPWSACCSLDQGYSFSLDESWSAVQGLLENFTKVLSVGSSVWQQWAIGHTKQFLRGCTSAPS